MTEDELKDWEKRLTLQEAQILGRQILQENKERDLAIYEERVRRLYKDAFPDLEMKLRI